MEAIGQAERTDTQADEDELHESMRGCCVLYVGERDRDVHRVKGTQE